MILTHRFTSPKLDGPDLTQVQPSAWNDGHRFQGGADGDVLTRATADGAFGATWTAPVGWLSYPVQWLLDSTIVVLWGGHHFEHAMFHKRGNAVWFQILFVVGTEPIPAGNWLFTLPFPSISMVSPGSGLMTTALVGVPLFLSSGGFVDRFYVAHMTASQQTAALTSTTPINMAANPGMKIEVRGYYQSA